MRNKEYFLKLSEEVYNELTSSEELFLSNLGLEVKQLPTDEDLKDETVKNCKKEIAKNYEKINKYLFDKRNNFKNKKHDK